MKDLPPMIICKINDCGLATRHPGTHNQTFHPTIEIIEEVKQEIIQTQIIQEEKKDTQTQLEFGF